LTDSLKIRFRHDWHMRWPHFNFADFDCGISSDRQVKHVILKGGQYNLAEGKKSSLTASLAQAAVALELTTNCLESLTAYAQNLKSMAPLWQSV
jgi:hypothetical protein